MDKPQLLPFIENDKLYEYVRKVLEKVGQAADEAESRLYSNVVDPFSAVFDASRQKIALTDWLHQEEARQVQKTLQNALGTFHQEVLGSMPGWENLPTGSLVDVRNTERQIVAEVKNKWNTTKGSDKKSIYDNLQSAITTNYAGFTGYYVEVIPKSPQPFDTTFTPSDNVTHTVRPVNEKIRTIDGRGFYALASGIPDALDQLYTVLPDVIGEVLSVSTDSIKSDPLFSELFSRVYSR